MDNEEELQLLPADDSLHGDFPIVYGGMTDET
jgi:hypothetical protein